jgi:hypothetical protein
MAESKFDLITHQRNGKGQVVSKNPYRLVVENGIQRFERPPGSGFWYDAAGKLVAEPKAAEPEVVATEPKGKSNGASPKA